MSSSSKNNTRTDAVRTVNEGGIIIYPTDTAFGIGCRIDVAQAVDRLFRIRKRDREKATPILVSSIGMALPYFRNPPNIVRRMMEKHWPGALTIVYWCEKSRVYSPVRGNGDTIGIRMPDHAQLLDIIKRIGVPIIGSSANISGGRTPYIMDELDPDLVSKVDMLIEGECRHAVASTVVDCTSEPYTIIRQGAIELSTHNQGMP